MPSFIAIGPEKATSWAWENGALTKQGEAANVRHAASLDDGWLATAESNGTEWQLALRDRWMGLALSRPVDPVGAMTAQGGLLYVATRWNLTIYDSNLDVIGRADVEPSTRLQTKQLDMIGLHDGHAFLVDDVVFPWLVFQVDVTDPSHPRREHEHSITASTAPAYQWLDPVSGTWFIHTSFHGRQSDSWMTRYSIADGTEVGTQSEAHDLADTEFLLPAWGLSRGTGGTNLMHFEAVESLARLTCVYPVPFGEAFGTSQDAIVLAGGGEVAVLTKDRPPVRIAHGPGIGDVRDLIVLD